MASIDRACDAELCTFRCNAVTGCIPAPSTHAFLQRRVLVTVAVRRCRHLSEHNQPGSHIGGCGTLMASVNRLIPPYVPLSPWHLWPLCPTQLAALGESARFRPITVTALAT